MKVRCMSVFTTLGIAALSCLAFTPPVSAATLQVDAQRQLANQSQEEIEPAAITYTHFGVEYSVAVWMNFDPNPTNNRSTLKYTMWSSTGNTNTSTIPAHASYPFATSRYADPVLVKHPTQVQIYLVALAINGSNSAILVWSSQNGGFNWSSPTVVTSTTGNPILDKPAAATAPDGKLWIAYLRSNLYVQHGTLSGSPATWSWSTPQVVGLTGATGPQIMIDSMVNSAYDIYILDSYWNQGFELIRGTYNPASTPQLSFPMFAQEWQPSASRLYLNDYITVETGVHLRAESVPVAKLDRANRRIAMAWPEENSANRTSTRVKFGVYNITTDTWNYVTLAAAANRHDLNVGMDRDASGNYLVTWTRFDIGQSTYTNRARYVTINASGVPTADAEIAIGSGGDIEAFTPVTMGLSGTSISAHLMGEYHDVSFTNGTFKAAHLAGAAQIDPWAYTVRVLP